MTFALRQSVAIGAVERKLVQTVAGRPDGLMINESTGKLTEPHWNMIYDFATARLAEIGYPGKADANAGKAEDVPPDYLRHMVAERVARRYTAHRRTVGRVLELTGVAGDMTLRVNVDGRRLPWTPANVHACARSLVFARTFSDGSDIAHADGTVVCDRVVKTLFPETEKPT